MYLILAIGLCDEPPISGKSALDQIRDEAAQLKTQTALGTISMTISGLRAGEGVENPSGKVELGVVHIAELGGMTPKRVEITPFVYNEIETTALQEVNLEKDQGVGVKVQLGNPDREWAIFLKATVSTEAMDRVEPVNSEEFPGTFSVGFERKIGSIDPEKSKRLKRLRDLPKPIIIYVSNDDFKGPSHLSQEAIRVLHRNIMSTYLAAAIERWMSTNPQSKDPASELQEKIISAPALYYFLREELISGRPLYIRNEDGEEKAIRPMSMAEQLRFRTKDQPLQLFNPHQMLYDFVYSLEYPAQSAQK